MFINLSDVFTSEGKVLTMSAPLEMTHFKSRLGSFKLLQKPPIAFTFTHIGPGKVHVSGSVSLVFDTRCDRCLSPVQTVVPLSFDRVVFSPDAEVTEDDDAEVSFMEGWQLDADAFVLDELLVSWPAKILCKEDCKGVCPVCGQNRNERDCGCNTFVPDPRFANLQEIFDANKEV